MTPARRGFDYVIVGGGSSGSVAAWRLVRERGARVLLLEAGPRRMNPIMHMPAGYMKYLARDTYLTMHQMVPQPQLDGRQTVVPQARVLGGGSSVNAMVYMRGQPADYDAWAARLGQGDHWSWGDMLPRFKALEGNDHLGEPFHGTAGPLAVSQPHYRCAMTDAFVAAAQNAGEVFNPDFNGGRQRGVGYMQSTIGRNRRRCSVVDAFLEPLARDPRLTIRTGAQVTDLIFDGQRATGVRIVEGGQVHEIYAEAEILLAAGSYVTPKLLMLSGIGPATTLSHHAIPVRVDLPGVGQNLQDHCEVPVIYASNGRYGYHGQDRGWRMIRNGLEYLAFRSGPVTTIGVEACAFVAPGSDDPATEASVKIYCVPTIYLDRDVSGIDPCDGLTMTCCLLRPGSRGAVTIASADPLAAPVVDGGFLSDPADQALMQSGLATARRIAAQAPLSGLLAREIAPGDGDPVAHAKRMVKTNYHPVGTCRMGPDGDADAVLDWRLRVRGVEGLRVIDCSVMPAIVSGNTNAPAMVIGHKAVDLL